MNLLLNPNIDAAAALDVAFFATVLDLFDYKFSVSVQTVSALFREDFKLYIVNAKLRQIGGCPEMTSDQ